MSSNPNPYAAYGELHDVDERRQRLSNSIRYDVAEAWHTPTAPKKVHDAHAALLAAKEAAEDALAVIPAIRSRAKAEEKGRLAEHAAYAAGKGPKPSGSFKYTDVRGEQMDALLQAEALIGRMHGLKDEYRRLADDPEVLEQTREKALQAHEGTREKVVEAVNILRAAWTSYVRSSDQLQACTAKLVWGEDAIRLRPRLSRDTHRMTDDLDRAWSVLDLATEISDPALTGDWARKDLEELRKVAGDGQ